ncbi:MULTISPECIES: transposase [unclassified Streptomyces]|uniref:transposase n=1 Tax=unclassified Streptomyces TaxID=2593676 RepID=UPI002DDA94CE|nr:transposase [Streptomyces sp. NBC_01445]WSE10131.1 transposase [Streptomyces sp. NBC_01445]
MAEKRRVFTAEFREGAVRIVTEAGKPVPEVAEDLGINETTPASWESASSGEVRNLDASSALARHVAAADVDECGVARPQSGRRTPFPLRLATGVKGRRVEIGDQQNSGASTGRSHHDQNCA